MTEPGDLANQAADLYKKGQFMASSALYSEAQQAYLGLDDPLTAAEMANNSSVAYLRGGDASAALQAAMQTDQTFAQAGDRKRQAIALGNLAAAHEALGNLQEALSCYQTSAELLKQIGDRESRSYVLKSISALQIRMHQPVEGMLSMQAALDNSPRLSAKERILKSLLDIPHRLMGGK
jgi:tetratricopeptide (TPR) repeat protein